MKLLSVLIDYIDDNRNIYSAILSHNQNGFLIDFLIDVIEKDASTRLKNNYNPDFILHHNALLILFLCLEYGNTIIQFFVLFCFFKCCLDPVLRP